MVSSWLQSSISSCINLVIICLTLRLRLTFHSYSYKCKSSKQLVNLMINHRKELGLCQSLVDFLVSV